MNMWIFHGDHARFAAAVFETGAAGLSWAAKHRVSGILTEYPVGDGCYDIALAAGHFTPSRPHHGSPEHVASFSPGWTQHVHLENGEPSWLQATPRAPGTLYGHQSPTNDGH